MGCRHGALQAPGLVAPHSSLCLRLRVASPRVCVTLCTSVSPMVLISSTLSPCGSCSGEVDRGASNRRPDGPWGKPCVPVTSPPSSLCPQVPRAAQTLPPDPSGQRQSDPKRSSGPPGACEGQRVPPGGNAGGQVARDALSPPRGPRGWHGGGWNSGSGKWEQEREAGTETQRDREGDTLQPTSDPSRLWPRGLCT